MKQDDKTPYKIDTKQKRGPMYSEGEGSRDKSHQPKKEGGFDPDTTTTWESESTKKQAEKGKTEPAVSICDGGARA